MQIGFGFIGAFGIIFFYELFSESIIKTMVLYALLHVAFTIATPIGARLIQKIGMKKMMLISLIFILISLYSRIAMEDNVLLFLSLFFISLVLYKVLYWIPYHVEFATFTDKHHRGRQMAFFTNISKFILAFLPMISGFILWKMGYNILFWIAIFFIIVSIIPLFYIKETHEEYTWSLRNLFGEFFKKENKPLVIGSIARGFEDGVGVVIWPIFVFILLDGNYLFVGIISSLVIFTIIIAGYVTGELIDRLGTKKVLLLSSFLNSTGWISKVFIESGFGIFISDTYHSFGKLTNKMSYDVTVYEQAADNGHYIDEYTVLKETSFLFGKLVVLVLCIGIVSFIGIRATFIIAAFAVLVMNIISRKTVIS